MGGSFSHVEFQSHVFFSSIIVLQKNTFLPGCPGCLVPKQGNASNGSANTHNDAPSARTPKARSTTATNGSGQSPGDGQHHEPRASRKNRRINQHTLPLTSAQLLESIVIGSFFSFFYANIFGMAVVSFPRTPKYEPRNCGDLLTRIMVT